MQSTVDLSVVNKEWQPLIANALDLMDSDYLDNLYKDSSYIPRPELVFSAFKPPLSEVKYILLGESPYPREVSANGYAFWDSAIDSIWSETGFSKELNRATSLRNFVKMLLYVRGDLQDDFSQSAIAKLDKGIYLRSISDLFHKLLGSGFLLLNASLIYSVGKVPWHARHWRPFIDKILQQVIAYDSSISLILLGKISEKFADSKFKNKLIAEHPYNISFIQNKVINEFFKPFDLLARVS